MEGNWDWELGSKTRTGSWEERWRLDEIFSGGDMGERHQIHLLTIVRGDGGLGRCMNLGSSTQGSAEG